MIIVAEFVELDLLFIQKASAGRGSSIGCKSAWYADGRGFDPHVRQYSFLEFGQEIISTASLVLPLIQAGQLSVLLTKECALNTCKLPRTLAQEQNG